MEDLELFFFSSLDGAGAAREADEPDLGKALPDAPLERPVPPPFRGLDLPLSLAEMVQVRSLTQFYYVDFSQSTIGVESAFSTNAQSSFVSAVLDGVLGHLRHV